MNDYKYTTLNWAIQNQQLHTDPIPWTSITMSYDDTEAHHWINLATQELKVLAFINVPGEEMKEVKDG